MSTRLEKAKAMATVIPILFFPALLPPCAHAQLAAGEAVPRPRARDLGITVGDFACGEHNAITDVPGVRVGHTTLWKGASIRTGVTAILPHGGDLFAHKVAAAFDCYNGFGKPFGSVQVEELGRIETPIVLGSTLSVPRIADAVMTYVMERDKTGRIVSINPVVGETNDGYLSDGRARPVRPEHVLAAIRTAESGAVDEGCVGAGTGTRCLGYKGGIGTSSRRVGLGRHEWMVGVLVQTNFGGDLRILGRRVPPEDAAPRGREERKGGGSCVSVVGTNAPLTARQLRRLARRAFAGMARTGASFSHGSGDYAFAFSTGRLEKTVPRVIPADAELSPLFRATADATEEAIYNSLLRARTVRGRDGHVVKAISIERVREMFGNPGTTTTSRGTKFEFGHF